MDVFGKRFQKELEQMKRDVAKWQTSPGPTEENETGEDRSAKRQSIDAIPLLDDSTGHESARATGAQMLNDTNGSITDRRGS
jgi:hypothetical protein